MNVWVIEFPSESGEFPEVWGDRNEAHKRFMELYERYGNKEEGLNDDWAESGYMSFDDKDGSMYCIDLVPVQGGSACEEGNAYSLSKVGDSVLRTCKSQRTY